MGFVKIYWKNNVQDTYFPKTSTVGQIVSEILAQLCSDDSIQILLILTWVWTFRSFQKKFCRFSDRCILHSQNDWFTSPSFFSYTGNFYLFTELSQLKVVHVWASIACEQALLFGRVKRVSRERASARSRDSLCLPK